MDKDMPKWDAYLAEYFLNARKAGLTGDQLWALLTRYAERAQVIAIAEHERCKLYGLPDKDDIKLPSNKTSR